ncbi:NAD-dependent protein deacylase [Luteimonas sp. BDR2-5]|uniref:SIR2 family NAD-dependent protein deacylase n=1 Tax=Proluteimonas luteida TaxID=2878685 RepID=UPI001E476DA0|nr:NAD-dependent protein deacylase [Luteimonas sp. BDR2-5]MCD9027088.1 NAD-dependent protein deacylase [Luteimonas sp. BDR2-5]
MRIAVLSGAGLSADSGIPTFRDAPAGLWARFDPAELATAAAFRRDPALVWGWYRWRAAMVRAARPNAGHAGIAGLAAAGHAVDVVTQNVDDLHERAGSRDVVHLHGRLLASRCIDCGARSEPDPMLGPGASPATGAREPPPACDRCGGDFRPDVVWFGEPLPVDAWRAAHEAIARCALLVVVGTSSLVQPAAGLPDIALAAGTPVLEINPAATGLSPRADAHWRTGASDGIARLAAALAAAPDNARDALRSR